MTIYVFSVPWVIIMIALAGVGAGLYRVGRKLDLDGRRRLLLAAALANWAFYGAYQYGLATSGRFADNVVTSMPFQLCTWVTIGLVPTLLLNWRWLRCLAFFAGSLTGFLALFSPAIGIEGVSVFSPLALGFFGSHGLNMVICVLIAALGFYEPTYRGAGQALLEVVAWAGVVLVLNLFARATYSPKANYFYMFDPEGAAVFELLRGFISLPVVYLLPLLPFAYLAFLGQAAAYRGLARLGRPKGELAATASPGKSQPPTALH